MKVGAQVKKMAILYHHYPEHCGVVWDMHRHRTFCHGDKEMVGYSEDFIGVPGNTAR